MTLTDENLNALYNRVLAIAADKSIHVVLSSTMYRQIGNTVFVVPQPATSEKVQLKILKSRQ
jgi:uncharacterized membrane protein